MMVVSVQIFQTFQEVRIFRANRLLKSVLWKKAVTAPSSGGAALKR